MFVVVWQFEVKPECEKVFRSFYGGDGDWVRLFRQDASYEKSILLTDPSSKYVYWTLDFWKSRAAYDAFQKKNDKAYQMLDRACESLTVSERHLGSFEGVA